MSLSKLEAVDVIYDDKEDGQVIDPSEWNNNFYVLESKANSNKDKVNAMIDVLESVTDGSSGADAIGATSITGLTGVTVQGLLEALKAAIDLTYTKPSVDTLLSAKATNATVNELIKSVSLNETTGVITFTKQSGSTFTIDTLLEKIITNWEFDQTTQKITFTNKDGTTSQLDLSSFISNNEFSDSDQIDFTVTSGVVTATIKAGSITQSMLESTLLSTILGYKTAAATSATNAAASETNASTYATNANTSATSASTSATSASASATTATTKAGIATTKATEAAESATEAAESAALALQYKNAADTSKTTASTKAGEASTSASEALASKTAAATSATNAATSEANALTYKNAAESAKTAAETAKTNAVAAKTAAETAKTAAQTAKTAAETAETNAEASATAAANSAAQAQEIAGGDYATNSSLNTHTSNATVHITAAERTAWNAKAANTDLTAHTGNTTVHVTAAERTAWNAKQAPATTLSGYGITNAYTKTETDTKLGTKIDKVTGKSLSTNDYTTDDKTKVGNLPNNTNAELDGKGNTNTFFITDPTTLTIPVASWVTNTVSTEADELEAYPFMAFVPIPTNLTGNVAVSTTDGGEITPKFTQATDGIMAQPSYTAAGGVYILATEAYTEAITLAKVEIRRAL